MTLEQMKNVDIRTVDKATLVEAAGVTVNMEQPKIERMTDTARQLGNPYCFKYNNIAVKIEHADTTATIDDRVESLMRTY